MHPRDDLATALVQAQLNGSHFSMAEMIWQMIILLTAGHETTTSMICSMLYHLLKNPELLRAIDSDPGLIPAAIEETLRLEAPIQYEPRITTEPVELRGVAIPKGARLHLMFGSASRDPEVFPEPDRFDLYREGNRTRTSGHLAFGHGVHFCLGAPLARLEGRVALEVLRERLPNLRLPAGFTAEWLPHPLFHGLRALPLQWDVT